MTPIATASPFITVEGEASASEDEMDAFIKREEIDIVCVTDASRDDMVSTPIYRECYGICSGLTISHGRDPSLQVRINAACRRTSTLFYGAGGYAFSGYIFSDLGPSCEYFAT